MTATPALDAARAAAAPATSLRWRRRALNVLKVAVAVGLLAWLTLSGKLDFARLVQATRSSLLPAVLGLTLISLVLPAWRWLLLLKIQDLHTSFWEVLQLTWLGYFTALVLPGAAGGDLAKGYFMLRLQPAARVRALSTVLVDRLLGVYSLLLLASLSLAWLTLQGRLPSAIQAVGMSTLLLLIGTSLTVVALANRQTRRWCLALLPRSWKTALTDSLDRYCAAPVTLVACLAVSLLSNALVVLSLAAAAPCIGTETSLSAVFLAGPIVILSNCVPITPGGIGVAEAVSAGLFGAFAITGGAEMMLLVRLTIAALSLPGCAGLFSVSHNPAVAAPSCPSSTVAVEEYTDMERLANAKSSLAGTAGQGASESLLGPCP